MKNPTLARPLYRSAFSIPLQISPSQPLFLEALQTPCKHGPHHFSFPPLSFAISLRSLRITPPPAASFFPVDPPRHRRLPPSSPLSPSSPLCLPPVGVPPPPPPRAPWVGIYGCDTDDDDDNAAPGAFAPTALWHGGELEHGRGGRALLRMMQAGRSCRYTPRCSARPSSPSTSVRRGDLARRVAAVPLELCSRCDARRTRPTGRAVALPAAMTESLAKP